MKIVAYVHVWEESEVAPVNALLDRFPTLMALTWLDGVNRMRRVPRLSMMKNSVEWSRRFLTHFVQRTDADLAIKIDPDTEITGNEWILPGPTVKFDVAGDFRVFEEGWLFMGGYQVFKRTAATAILADPGYTGRCRWQDAALGAAIHRLDLIAYNMKSVNVWADAAVDRTSVDVYHAGRSDLDRPKPGRVILE